MQSRSGSIGFPTPVLSRRFRRKTRVLFSTAVPLITCAMKVHPLVRFTPLQSPSRLRSARDFGCPKSKAPSLGLRSLIATSTTASSLEHPMRSLPFRPRRFSRPRRLPPRLAWWAYFIPLPRPGFTLQGFDSSSAAVSPFSARCPLAVRPTSLQVVAHLLHSVGPRLQGFHPRKSP